MDNKEVCAKKLVYYAVDKASPYALAQHKETGSYDEVEKLTLAQLAITDHGLGLMWNWINAYASQCKLETVPANVASACKTVQDIYKALTRRKEQ